MSGETQTISEQQATLLDLDTRELNAYWVNPAQPLQVPKNPLHFAAHKYQLILARLDIQAAKNGAQFNSGNYIAIMEKLEQLWEKINKADGVGNDAEHDTSSMVADGNEETAPPMGERAPIGMDSGISANNPFAG